MEGPQSELECATLFMPQVREKINRARQYGGNWTSYWAEDLNAHGKKIPPQCTPDVTIKGIARLLAQDGYSVEFDREYFPPTMRTPGRYVPHVSVEWPRG